MSNEHRGLVMNKFIVPKIGEVDYVLYDDRRVGFRNNIIYRGRMYTIHLEANLIKSKWEINEKLMIIVNTYFSIAVATQTRRNIANHILNAWSKFVTLSMLSEAKVRWIKSHILVKGEEIQSHELAISQIKKEIFELQEQL